MVLWLSRYQRIGTSMRQVRAVFLTIVIVMLAGCSGQSTTVKPFPTAIPLVQNTLQTQAWGTVRVEQFVKTVGSMWFEQSSAYFQNIITDDDQLCGTVVHKTSNNLQGIQNGYSVALLNLHTGVVTKLQTIPNGYYLASCAATGSWIIWSQSLFGDSPFESNSWQVKAINYHTKEVRTLDSSVIHSSIPFPSAGNGWAAWTSLTGDQKNTVALFYNFADGKKTAQAIGTAFPLISWPWVCWGDSVVKGIVFQNMETQQQINLPFSRPSTAAFNDGAFVASNSDYSAITLYPSINAAMSSTSYVVGHGIAGDFVEFPTLNDRLVTWVSNESLYAYDRKLKQTVAIMGTARANPSPFVSGHYLVWETPGQDLNNYSEYTLNILDTNTLP